MGHRLRPTRRRANDVVPLVLLAFSLGGLAACEYLPGSDQGITDGIGVDNRTAVAMRFEIVIDGRRLRLVAVSAHATDLVIGAGHIKTGRCTTEPLIAFSTADGREVARHDEPLCVGDTWVIEESDLRSPASSVASPRRFS